MSDFTLKDSDAPFTVSVSFKDALGASVAVVGETCTWVSSDPAVLVVTPAADGLSASGAPVGPGTATVALTVALADGSVLDASGTVTVEAGAPTQASLAFVAG